MHYYKFNISDWQSGTRHLTPEEEGVYFRLINYYYDTEKPIPLETDAVIRKLVLGSHSDIVNDILNEFFVKTDRGYEKEKCNELIKEYKKTASKNRKNGALGGRPRKDKASAITQSVPSGLDMGTQKEPKHNPNHKPLTINQEPRTTNQFISEAKPQSKPKQPKFDASQVDFIGLNRGAWLEWVDYRKGMRKPVSKAAAKKQTDELLQFDEVTQGLMIDHSIKNDYTGIFPLKQNNANYGNQKSNIDSQKELLRKFGGDGYLSEGVISDQ